jgi:hypothetical protein
MIYFGFSARHLQQIEAGRAITVTTLLRVWKVFELPMAKEVPGLDAESMRLQASSRPQALIPFAAILLLESAPQEGFTCPP